MQKFALKMIKKGYALEEVADNLEMPLEWVQELAERELVAV
jgi:cytidylate kinase